MILGDVRGEGHSYEYSAQHMLRISTRADISRAVTPTHELSRFKSAITQEERKREGEGDGRGNAKYRGIDGATIYR